MPLPPHEGRSLRDVLTAARPPQRRFLWGAKGTIALSDLSTGSCLDSPGGVQGRSVLLLTEDPLAAASALIELDGSARRVILCPPDLPREHLSYVVATAQADTLVCDTTDVSRGQVPVERWVRCGSAVEAPREPYPVRCSTEWILFTSGTTGLPKMVEHSLASLAGAITPDGPLAQPAVWATFYDIRRFGGLQIFLRAMLGGGSLVVAGPDEPISDCLVRAVQHGVTHITGTPSHWRRLLMSAPEQGFAPRYVRLSGEIADQPILDSLRARFPQAQIGHAFATTEAGVVFEVNDERAGFPAVLCASAGPVGVELKVVDGTLRVRSPRTARRYLGEQGGLLRDPEGYVDTGDLLELRDDRYYFVGRRGGIINVGGLKVHPEEVEAVINRHPRVRMSLVRSRKSPITGSLVVAEVVLIPELEGATGADDNVREGILAECKRSLAAHKVPAMIRIVPSLPLTAGGKVARTDA